MNEIFNALMEGVLFLVRGVMYPLYALPDVGLSGELNSSVQTVLQVLNMTNVFVPVSTLLDCMGVLFIFVTALIAYKFVRFGMKFIPFIG